MVEKNNKSKISACIVTHNDEEQIERCLNSLKGVVDEIIIVHDGPCSDHTIAIARRFTKNVFVGKKLGNPEPHRVTTFKKATGEWVLVIDPDEFLSTRLRRNLRRLVNSNRADGYFFLWRLWDGKKYITKKWPYRIGVVKKKQLRFLAILHPDWQIPGKIINVDYSLEHRPRYNNFTFKSILTKNRWARLHAEQILTPLNKIPRFQYPNPKLPRHIEWIKKYNLLIAPFIFLYMFSASLLLTPVSERRNMAKYSFLQALYYVNLCIEVWKLKTFKKNIVQTKVQALTAAKS